MAFGIAAHTNAEIIPCMYRGEVEGRRVGEDQGRERRGKGGGKMEQMERRDRKGRERERRDGME